jgi:hypothetical protein
MRRLFLVGGFLLISFCVFSQNRLGLTSGDYAGVNGVQLNPASGINSYYYLDIQLGGGGVFALNNYLFLRNEDYSVGGLLSKNPEFPTFTNEFGDSRYLDLRQNQKLKSGYSNQQVMGPSVMLTLGRNSFAFFTGFRSLVRAKDFSYDVARNIYEGLDYPPFHNVTFDNKKAMHLETIQFSEIGASYSRNVYARDYDKVDVGITLKYLLPHNGFKLFVENINYMMPNSDTLIINDMNGELRSSVPVDYENNSFPDETGWVKGSGFGVDLGVVYTKTKSLQRPYNRYTRLCRQRRYDYHYRLWLSLLDIGSVSFKDNVQVHRYRDVSTEWPDVGDLDFENTNQMLRDISRQLTGSEGASQTGEEQFTMRLPMALSMQADYHFFRNWYTHATVIYGFPGGAGGYNRPHYVGVMPRYENAVFGAGMPVSLHDFRQPQLGFNVRLFYLTIGTANLAHYAGLSDFNGIDFYFSLKFNIRKGKCGRGGGADCNGYEYGLPGKF